MVEDNRQCVLIVERNSRIAQAIWKRLTRLGYRAEVLSPEADAMEHIAAVRPDAALVDLSSKERASGIRVARELRDRFNIPVIFLSARNPHPPALQENLGPAFRHLLKPFTERDLKTTLDFVLYQRQIEQQLRDAERKYQTLVEQVSAVTYLAEIQNSHSILSISPQAQALLGYSLDEWKQNPELWWRLIHAQDRERVRASIASSEKMEQPIALEYRLTARDGHLVWVRDQATVVRDEAGRPRFWQGVLLDVTERRRAEALIEENTGGMTALSHVDPMALTSSDLEVVLNQVIDEVFPLFGAEGLAILLRRDQSLVFAAVRGACVQALVGKSIPANVGVAGKVLQTGQSQRVTGNDSEMLDREIERITDYHIRDWLAVPLRVGDATIGVIQAVHHETGVFTLEHLRLLEAAGNWAAVAIENARLFNQVVTAKKEWEDTIDTLGEGISLVDDAYRILRVNRTLAEWLETTPQKLVGKFCYEEIDGCAAPPESCPHAQLMRGRDNKRDAEMELPRLRKTFHFTAYPLRRANGDFVGSVNVLDDITERLLQAQLVQSEKLAATKRLSASIAHEINNPLQAIQGCIDLAEANLGEASKQQRYLAMAKTELNRLATVVQRMLEFYRTDKGKRTWLDVRALMEDVIALNAKRLQHANVRVKTEWASNLPAIHGVGEQLQQVFLNIILNAIEAMPRGGDLKISGCVREDPNHGVAIAFEDSGAGIAQENLGKIFEPFYTTKPNGTGLGLGISHNIVTDHGGLLTVESVVGRGSTFTVWLPTP